MTELAKQIWWILSCDCDGLKGLIVVMGLVFVALLACLPRSRKP